MNAQPTRRGLLGAMASVPALGLLAMPAAASARSDWPAAYARFLAAESAWADWTDKVYNPTVERIDAAAPMPEMAWTVKASSGQEVRCHFDQARPDYYDGMMGPAGEQGRRIKSEYETWKIKHAAISSELGMTDIDADDDRYCQAEIDARKAAFAASVGSTSELLEKVALMDRILCGDFHQDHIDTILSDLGRLTAEGR